VEGGSFFYTLYQRLGLYCSNVNHDLLHDDMTIMTFVHLNQEQVEYNRNLMCSLVLVLCDEMRMQSLDLHQQITEDYHMEQYLELEDHHGGSSSYISVHHQAHDDLAMAW
jgi:hypothetical protein